VGGPDPAVAPRRGGRLDLRLRQRGPELFVNLVEAAQSGDLTRAAELHRRVLTLVTLGVHSDPAMGAIKVAMNKLGVPISPAVRGPALPATDEEAIEAVLDDVGLLEPSKTG
jgi:dihydrodipicolinate synthase/N-acetylneuraminate lyase